MPPPQPPFCHLGILCLQPAPYQSLTVRVENWDAILKWKHREAKTVVMKRGGQGKILFSLVPRLSTRKESRAMEKSLQDTGDRASAGHALCRKAPRKCNRTQSYPRPISHWSDASLPSCSLYGGSALCFLFCDDFQNIVAPVAGMSASTLSNKGCI